MALPTDRGHLGWPGAISPAAGEGGRGSVQCLVTGSGFPFGTGAEAASETGAGSGCVTDSVIPRPYWEVTSR